MFELNLNEFELKKGSDLHLVELDLDERMYNDLDLNLSEKCF